MRPISQLSQRVLRRGLLWPARTIGAVVLILALLAVPLACRTLVIAPHSPRDPVTVYLLDHGRTPSLVLTDSGGSLVRWAYGDWKWYALDETGLASGVRALFWPTQSALGRQALPAPTTGTARGNFGLSIENLYEIRVERADAARLQRRLEALHSDARATEVSSRYGLRFVHHPRRYTYFHNSNHQTAAWLRELGCRTHGPAFSSRWRVITQPSSGAAMDLTSPPRRAATSDYRVPLWLRVATTLFLCLLVPVYWHHYGPSNFLWFSDIALFVGVLALWLENRLLASMMAVAVVLPELAWNLEFFARLITGRPLIGLAGYMWDRQIPLLVRGVSLFHIWLPVLLLWMVWLFGYDRRAWLLQSAAALVVLPATWLLTCPADNINWVYGPGSTPQSALPPIGHLLAVMVFFPVAVYLPTHLLLLWLWGPNR